MLSKISAKEMTTFSDKIINKIKCDSIEPVPRWHFLFKGCAFWALFVISMILGSLSFSVIVHIASSGDFGFLNHLQGNLITSAVMLLPYFWILFLILFAISAYLNWKCTKRGYRYKRRWIVLGSFALSILFGYIFFLMGMAKEVDKLMSRAIPFYDKSKHDARVELWFQPDSGFLTGKIIEIDEEKEKLIVRDENGANWEVDDLNVKWENQSLENKGKVVKIIGNRDGDYKFSAKEIRRCNNCQDDEDN